jgi:hypothetical protein
LAGKAGEGLFGVVGAAGHERQAIGEDEVLVTATRQLHESAVRRKRFAEQFEGLHKCDVTGNVNVSKNGVVESSDAMQSALNNLRRKLSPSEWVR